MPKQRFTTVGLKVGIVKLEPYNDQWPRLFTKEQSRLRETIGEFALDIQHIGSTSIPGMMAKSIIDIGIALSSYADGEQCVTPLNEIGYEYRGNFGVPGRHYFVGGEGDTGSHLFHVHMFVSDTEDWHNLLRFRDYLIKHKETAEEYMRLKITLSSQFENDRAAYTAAKRPFIRKVLDMAVEV